MDHSHAFVSYFRIAISNLQKHHKAHRLKSIINRQPKCRIILTKVHKPSSRLMVKSLSCLKRIQVMESGRKFLIGRKKMSIQTLRIALLMFSFSFLLGLHRSHQTWPKQASIAVSLKLQLLQFRHSTSRQTFCAMSHLALMSCCTHFNISKYKKYRERVASVACGIWWLRAASCGERFE